MYLSSSFWLDADLWGKKPDLTGFDKQPEICYYGPGFSVRQRFEVTTQSVAGRLFPGSQPSSSRAKTARVPHPERVFSAWDVPETGTGSNG